MPFRQEVFATVVGIGLLVLIFELVRRKKLREEYCWLWMLTGLAILILAVWDDLLLFITRLIGAALPASAIFFFGVFFLVLINLCFSMKISKLTDQIRKLTQRLALLADEVEAGSSTAQGK